MRVAFVLIFLFSFSFGVHAQFESSKRKVKISILPEKISKKKASVTVNNPVTVPPAIKFESQYFKNPDDKLLQGLPEIPKVGEIKTKRYKLKDPSEIFEEKSDELTEEFTTKYITTNYGVFKSATRKIKILCRDYDYVDFDRVRVLINDKPEIKDCVLGSEYTTYYVELPKYSNLIDFMAMNVGENAPNTAEFKILDDNDVLIYSNQWGLEEGYKARIVIQCDQNKF